MNPSPTDQSIKYVGLDVHAQTIAVATEAQVATWSRRPLVQALMCLRGLALLNAVTWVAEIGDFILSHPSPSR